MFAAAFSVGQHYTELLVHEQPNIIGKIKLQECITVLNSVYAYDLRTRFNTWIINCHAKLF